MKAAHGRPWVAELALLIGGQICLHSAMTGMRMTSPLLALSQGYGKAAAGLLVAMFALGQIFSALPAGRLAERRGIKLPITCSAIAVASAACGSAIWPIYPVLCACALLTGMGLGGASVVLQRHVGRVAADRSQLRQAFSWLTISPAAANCVGPFAAGLMIDHVSYSAAFMLMAALPVAAWLAIRATRDLPLAQPVSAASGSAWTIWRERGFRRIILTNWFMSTAWDVHGFMVPVLGHERGLSASAIGTVLASFAIAASLVRLATPMIAARVRDWILITCAMAATAALFCLYPLMHTALQMAACSAGIGLALGSVQPTVLSVLHHITPGHRQAEALAMRLMIINASNVATPVLFGAAGALLGANAVFWTMGAVIAVGCRVSLNLRAMLEEHADR